VRRVLLFSSAHSNPSFLLLLLLFSQVSRLGPFLDPSERLRFGGGVVCRDGRLYACPFRSRRVLRLEVDALLAPLAARAAAAAAAGSRGGQGPRRRPSFNRRASFSASSSPSLSTPLAAAAGVASGVGADAGDGGDGGGAASTERERLMAGRGPAAPLFLPSASVVFDRFMDTSVIDRCANRAKAAHPFYPSLPAPIPDRAYKPRCLCAFLLNNTAPT